jgi:hypothetical protein
LRAEQTGGGVGRTCGFQLHFASSDTTSSRQLFRFLKTKKKKTFKRENIKKGKKIKRTNSCSGPEKDHLFVVVFIFFL